MKFVQYRKIITLFAMLCLALNSACVKETRTMETYRPLTCNDVAANRAIDFSEWEIEAVLDESLQDNNNQQCWVSLMQVLLDERKDIPQRHLKKAVQEFNTIRNQAYFHKAVYRYFASMVDGREEFMTKDRAFLKAYAVNAINNAVSKRDKNLEQARLLCRTLDRDLYTSLFL